MGWSSSLVRARAWRFPGGLPASPARTAPDWGAHLPEVTAACPRSLKRGRVRAAPGPRRESARQGRCRELNSGQNCGPVIKWVSPRVGATGPCSGFRRRSRLAGGDRAAAAGPGAPPEPRAPSQRRREERPTTPRRRRLRDDRPALTRRRARKQAIKGRAGGASTGCRPGWLAGQLIETDHAADARSAPRAPTASEGGVE
jgi:hypothetical protein